MKSKHAHGSLWARFSDIMSVESLHNILPTGRLNEMATDARGGRRWEGINMALRLSGCKLRVLRVPLASGRLGRTAQQKYGGREGTPKYEIEHERGAADRDDRADERERTNAAGVSPNLIWLNGTVRRRQRHLIPCRGPRCSDNCLNRLKADQL